MQVRWDVYWIFGFRITNQHCRSTRSPAFHLSWNRPRRKTFYRIPSQICTRKTSRALDLRGWGASSSRWRLCSNGRQSLDHSARQKWIQTRFVPRLLLRRNRQQKHREIAHLRSLLPRRPVRYQPSATRFRNPVGNRITIQVGRVGLADSQRFLWSPHFERFLKLFLLHQRRKLISLLSIVKLISLATNKVVIHDGVDSKRYRYYVNGGFVVFDDHNNLYWCHRIRNIGNFGDCHVVVWGLVLGQMIFLLDMRRNSLN